MQRSNSFISLATPYTMKNEQNKSKPYCGACKQEFGSQQELTNHIKDVHGINDNNQ